MRSIRRRLLAVILFCGASSARASLPLETESARTMPGGQVKLETAAEIQTSKEGREIAVPLALEYAVTDDFEVQVEPVFFTAILPDQGPVARGLGDVEATATLRFLRETRLLPNLAVAVEVKLPTARNPRIGTGQADFTGYLVASKRFFDRLDLHLDLGYTFVGQPPGATLDNTINFGAALELHVTDRLDLLTEVIGNTAASFGADAAESGTAVPNPVPEAAAGELIGLLGVRYRIASKLWLSLGVTYDNLHAVLFRPGITWKFDTR